MSIDHEAAHRAKAAAEAACALSPEEKAKQEWRAAVARELLALSHSTEILQFFQFSHLPPQLADVSVVLAAAAVTIVETLPHNAERSVALRKLLEAKDAAVRARVYA